MSETKALSFENPSNDDLITALRVCGDDSKGCRVCPLFKSKPCGNIFDVVAERISQQQKQIESLQRETEPVPLTWDEVHKMAGKPIYIVPNNHAFPPYWDVIGGIMTPLSPLNRRDFSAALFYATEPKGE